MTPSDDLRARIRRRALRAAQAVTISLAMSGCYMDHSGDDLPDANMEPDGDILVMADVGPIDTGRPDTGVMPDTAVPDTGVRVDTGPEDTGTLADTGPDASCVPDPDCTGFRPDAAVGDGVCDWAQLNDCCNMLAWMPMECWLPGGPLAPPEMPTALA